MPFKRAENWCYVSCNYCHSCLMMISLARLAYLFFFFKVRERKTFFLGINFFFSSFIMSGDFHFGRLVV